MLESQRLQIEASKLRQEINSFDDAEGDIGDLQTKLENRANAVDVKLRSAIATEGETEQRSETPTGDADAESREFAKLEKRASVGDVFHVALSGGQTEGATREYQSHVGLAGNEIHVDQLRRGESYDIEKRAVVTSPTNTDESAAPIVPYVFPTVSGGVPRHRHADSPSW